MLEMMLNKCGTVDVLLMLEKICATCFFFFVGAEGGKMLHNISEIKYKAKQDVK